MLYRYIMTLIVFALPFYSNAVPPKLGAKEARARAAAAHPKKPLTNRVLTNTPALPSEPCLIAPPQPEQQVQPKESESQTTTDSLATQEENSAQEPQAPAIICNKPAQLPQPISKRSVDVGRTGCLRPGSRESSEMNTLQIKEYVPQQPTGK